MKYTFIGILLAIARFLVDLSVIACMIIVIALLAYIYHCRPDLISIELIKPLMFNFCLIGFLGFVILALEDL